MNKEVDKLEDKDPQQQQLQINAGITDAKVFYKAYQQGEARSRFLSTINIATSPLFKASEKEKNEVGFVKERKKITPVKLTRDYSTKKDKVRAVFCFEKDVHYSKLGVILKSN